MSDDDEKPVRRKDLVDLGETFKQALLPVSEVVTHMQEQNTRAAELSSRVHANSTHMRRLYHLLFVVGLMVCIGVAGIMYSLVNLLAVADKVRQTTAKLESVTTVAQAARVAADAARDATQEQANRGHVEIVQELDPEIAEDTPMRVRIVAPVYRESQKPSSEVTASEPPSAPLEPVARSEVVTAESTPHRMKASPKASRMVEIPISREALKSIE